MKWKKVGTEKTSFGLIEFLQYRVSSAGQTRFRSHECVDYQVRSRFRK